MGRRHFMLPAGRTVVLSMNARELAASTKAQMQKGGECMNNVSLAGLMLTSPTAAFAELRERPRFLVLLIVLAVALAAQQYW